MQRNRLPSKFISCPPPTSILRCCSLSPLPSSSSSSFTWAILSSYLKPPFLVYPHTALSSLSSFPSSSLTFLSTSYPCGGSRTSAMAHPHHHHHPLQRLPSPSRSFSALLHLGGIVSFSLSYKYLIDYPNFISDSYGWHWQFLTILGLTAAMVTFIFGLLADITLSRQLFAVKNTLSLCSAPLEVLISLLYWGISAIDKSLVVSPELATSVTADIGFHAVPSILLALDLLFFSPPWTIKALPAMGLSSAIAVCYWWWVEHCYSYNGW